MARTDTDQLFSGEITVLFLPSEATGSLIESKARALQSWPTKRERSKMMRELAQVLYSLSLVGREYAIVALAWGSSSVGEEGLVIVTKLIRIGGSVGPNSAS